MELGKCIYTTYSIRFHDPKITTTLISQRYGNQQNKHDYITMISYIIILIKYKHNLFLMKIKYIFTFIM